MNAMIAKRRMSEVLMVDSVNTSDADFLATHVPFRTIRIERGLRNEHNTETISEELIFQRYFDAQDMQDRHQLIVVEGSSGSGKSHFIRWIHAKLSGRDAANDVVMLIRRSDNTLKGTLQQLLALPEIQHVQNRDAYERLTKATQVVDEPTFRNQIYYDFLAQIVSDESGTLGQLRRKQLMALLNDDAFREQKMMKVGGPVDRIFHKITLPSGVATEDALFTESDFVLDTDFIESNMAISDNRARAMASKLVPDPDAFDDELSTAAEIADYMNGLIENVVRRSVNIQAGDFEQIFKEIRHELFKQGKNLVLLIEDITSCTGIDRAILNALIVEHTGVYESDQLCRLVSVIGTTSEYYRTFRDNYLDRITMQITLQDGALGSHEDDLVQFFAKYLNAMSLESDVLKQWHELGALQQDYPVCEDGELWCEHYDYNGKSLNLFPFTRQAVMNLYESLGDHKTPRYILRKIIEPTVNDWLYNPEEMLRFLSSQRYRLIGNNRSRVMSMVDAMAFDDETKKQEYRSRAMSMIDFWGDGTLNVSVKHVAGIRREYVAGIPREYFEAFGLDAFARGFGVDFSTTPPAVAEAETPRAAATVSVALPESYKTNEKVIEAWYFDGEPLRDNRAELRDAVGDFVFDTLNWQQEGVSAEQVNMAKTGNIKLVAIEKQERGADHGLLTLSHSRETYDLLNALNRWRWLGKKSWNYKEFENERDGICAASDLYVATSWLYRYTQRLVDAVSEHTAHSVPPFVKCAMALDLVAKLLSGNIACKKPSEMTVEMLLAPLTPCTEAALNGHTSEWAKWQQKVCNDERFNLCHERVICYFDLPPSNVSTTTRRFMRATVLEDTFKEVTRDLFGDYAGDSEQSKFVRVRTITKHFTELCDNVKSVMAKELDAANAQLEKLFAFWEYDSDTELEADDLRDLLNEIRRFYDSTERMGIVIPNRVREGEALKDHNADKAFEQAVALVQDCCESKKSSMAWLCAFSTNPMAVIGKVIAYLTEAQDAVATVVKRLEEEKTRQTQSGVWTTDTDPRFEEYKDWIEQVEKAVIV